MYLRTSVIATYVLHMMILVQVYLLFTLHNCLPKPILFKEGLVDAAIKKLHSTMSFVHLTAVVPEARYIDTYSYTNLENDKKLFIYNNLFFKKSL